MSLTAAQIRKAFLVIGKHIELALIGNATATQYEAHMMATVRQAVSGNAGEYLDFSTSIAPLQAQVQGFINTASQLPAVAQTAIDNYLQNSLSYDMGLASGLDSATILQSLALAMAAADTPQTVDPSGSSPTGFCNYFNTTYQVVLPQASPSGTISDLLISSAVMS